MTPGPTIRAFAIAAIATVAAALAGCEQSTWHFRPVDHRAGGDLRSEQARYTLAAQKGEAVVAWIEARGMRDRVDETGGMEGPDLDRDLVMVDVHVRNKTDLPVQLRPGDFRLIDDDGQSFGPPGIYGEKAAEEWIVAPGNSAAARLVFDLGAGQRLSRIGSFQLEWSAAVAGKLQTYATKFIKTEPAERYYYEPAYYGYYGHPGWYGAGVHYRRYYHPWNGYYHPHPYYLYGYRRPYYGRYWCD